MSRWPKKEVLDEEVSQVTTPTTKKKVRFLPYEGKEKLPPYQILSKGNDKRGKRPHVKAGEPRYTVLRAGPNTYKVMFFRLTPMGVVRRLFRVLKPSKDRPGDQSMLAELKACGIPGAF